MSWLLGTLVWTGVLIGFALLARRPVARHFGAKAAYALWYLPALRLALPPLVLPAWLAPPPVAASAPTGDVAMLALPTQAAPAATADSWIDWSALLMTVWIAGALIHAAVRLRSYFRLRRELLSDARVVGVAGRVRLVETSATASPLAFGVLDKVIALPPGFMAASDRRARDLALAHELAHHRGHDLAFNFLALPLFALHWFNPLSLLGWRAMRRDQEAACDARVVERCDRIERATYAALIARTVAGPRGALAAPMACPVLGDKSIVHRLRNLTMTAPSIRRRQMGALLIGAGALLLPLTASVSYARDETAPPPPTPPTAPDAPPVPLAPDSALVPAEPRAPLPPDAPPPPPPAARSYAIHGGAGDGEPREVVIVRDRKQLKGVRARRFDLGPVFRVVRAGKEGAFDEKAFEQQMKRLDEQLAHLDIERPTMPPEEIARITAEARRSARVAIAAAPRAPMIVMNCDGGVSGGGVSERTASDGRRVIRICRQRMIAPAAGSLRAARAQVARTNGMNPEARAQVLEQLDREIARLENANQGE